MRLQTLRSRRCRLAWMLPGLAGLAIVGCDRKVNLTFTSSSDNGVLTTDKYSSNFDQSATSPTSPVDVGGRAGQGEVVTFTMHRPPILQTPVDWAQGDATVNLKQEITLPVSIWIVKGPYQSQALLAFNSALYTNNVWANERMGTFMTISLHDATGNTKAANYYKFTCSQQNQMETDIGKTAGQINIYFVDQVDRGGGSYAQSNGNACAIGSDFVALGSAVGTDLMSHETGHDFALTHTDGNALFDVTNVMWSSSSSRQYFTEGQSFRAHLTSTSAINSVYKARGSQPTRSCGDSQDDAQCPGRQKRIWADGTFPAN